MVFVVLGGGVHRELANPGQLWLWSPISFRQGKLTTHKEEPHPKNPYLQDLLSAEVRASARSFQTRHSHQGPRDRGFESHTLGLVPGEKAPSLLKACDMNRREAAGCGQKNRGG